MTLDTLCMCNHCNKILFIKELYLHDCRQEKQKKTHIKMKDIIPNNKINYIK